MLNNLFKDYKVLRLPEHFTKKKRAFLFNETINKYKIYNVKRPNNDTEITIDYLLTIIATLLAIVSLKVNLSIISKCIFLKPAYKLKDKLKLIVRITSLEKNRYYFF